MAEYIDRSDALDAANSFIHAESIRLALEQLPVADVVSRKEYDELRKDNDICNAALVYLDKGQGTWEITAAFPHNVHCSVCHTKFAQAHWAIWKDGTLPKNYCPNCGARMVAE